MAFYKKNWAVTRLKKYFDHRGFLLRFGLSAVLLLFGFVASAHQSNFVKTSDLTVEGEKTVKFALDWLFTGAHAPFVMAADGGYFKKVGLNVVLENSVGAADAVEKVASGKVDFGLADLPALIAHNAKNPQNPLTAFYLVNERSPLSVMSLSERNIRTPKDLEGKRIGAPVSDAGRAMFALFAAAAGINASLIQWVDVEAQFRESRLMMGEIDAITGYFTAAHFLELQGVPAENIQIIKFSDVGVNLYSLALFARADYLASKPALVQAFTRAINNALKDTISKPEKALAFMPARIGNRFKTSIELKRLHLTLDQLVVTPFVRQYGLSVVDRQRLARNAADITSALKLPTLAPLAVSALYSENFLPSLAERQVPQTTP